MPKKWIFSKPLNITVVKIKGHHYVEETDFGLIEKEKDMVIHVKINEARDLKQLRLDVKRGKYAEFYNAPITDQLWAILAQKVGLMRLVEDEEEEEKDED